LFHDLSLAHATPKHKAKFKEQKKQTIQDGDEDEIDEG